MDKIYSLYVVSIEGDYQREGQFSSAEKAWQRNDDMGSRWCLYPIRVVVLEGKIVSCPLPGQFAEMFDAFCENLRTEPEFREYVSSFLS